MCLTSQASHGSFVDETTRATYNLLGNAGRTTLMFGPVRVLLCRFLRASRIVCIVSR